MAIINLLLTPENLQTQSMPSRSSVLTLCTSSPVETDNSEDAVIQQLKKPAISHPEANNN
jgi:hypothetical protein